MSIRQTLLAGLALASSVIAKAPETPTPSDGPKFNVTAALEAYGVYVEDIPALDETNRRSNAAGCQAACGALQSIFGNSAVSIPDEAVYGDFLDTFWSSIQSEVTPSCVFIPSEATDLSVMVLLSRLTNCPFAVRSGGHAAFGGASNVEDGITVSLENFQDVTLSEDQSIASVGAGNIWGPVYEFLEPHNLTVIGGRLYNIGVGGLTLGGGVSYFSNSHGWACDNVDSYEVILANGAPVKASVDQNPDLYWALRGGGNNFGIVHTFNMNTIPFAGEMWAGSRTYTEDQFPAVLDACTNMIASAADDPLANFYLVWVIAGGVKLAVPAVWHEGPEGGDAPSFDEWNAIPAVDDTTRVRNVVEWGRETLEDTPYGLREVFYMMTIKADRDVHHFAMEKYFEEALAVTDIEGFFANLVTQGINVPQAQQMAKNGGNALNIDPEDGPIYILQVCIRWDNAEDDDAVYRVASNILEATKAEALKRGVENDYLYMNYASAYQDVISSYGAENRARLKEIARRYDPQQVFQKLQPGYFKLDRAPIPGTDFFSL